MSYLDTFEKKVSKRKDTYIQKPGSFDYNGLAHWWVYNDGYMSTSNGRMHADGTRIYSYFTVIGKMFDPATKGGQPFILLAAGRYSNTTVRHMSAIRGAVGHMDYIYVDNPDPDGARSHKANMGSLLSSLEYLAEQYPRKRKDSTREATAREMHKNKETAEKYASYFKLRNTSEYKQISKFPMPEDENFEELVKESIRDKMLAEARKKALKAKKVAKENTKQRERERGRLEAWLRGENGIIPNPSYLEKVYLRIKDGIIETTEHASIGLMEAMKAYLRFKKGTLKEGMHIGSYTYGGIDDDGNAHVGCHVIPLKDIDTLLCTVIAERDAYLEDDQRQRDAEMQEELDNLLSFDELFMELGACMSGLDEGMKDMAGLLETDKK